MIRKTIALLLSIIFVINLFPSSVFAGESSCVSAGNCKVKPGGEADLTVSIANNPGLISFIIYVECDTDVFSLDYDSEKEVYEISEGDDFSSMLCNMQGSDGWKVVWYGSREVSSDGTLFTLPLKVADEAAAGSYEVRLSYSEKNTLNASYNKVGLDFINGIIEVLPTTASFSVQNEDCVPGGNMNLTVNIDANPGIASFMIYIDCDTSVFSIPYSEEKKAYETALGDFSQGGTIVCNKNGSRGYKVVWMDSVESLNSGSAFSLPVYVSSSAILKDYPVTLRVETSSICDANGNALPTELNSGVISLKSVAVASGSCRYSQKAQSLSVSIPVQNGTGADITVVCGVYENGKMVNSRTMTLSAFTAGTFESTFYRIGVDSSGLILKIFILSSGTCCPLTAVPTPIITEVD